MNKEEIVNKLFNNQLKNVDHKYRLNTKDIIRLSSYINSDPFSETECCKWRGAISKSTHQSKYINFWFNKKKQALHRILYLNYKGELHKNKYLKFTCPNPNMKGICCNINHIILINENDNDEENGNKMEKEKEQTDETDLNSTSNDKIELTQEQIKQLQLSETQLNQLKQLKQNQLAKHADKSKQLKQNNQEQKQDDDNELNQLGKTAKGKKTKKNENEENNNLIIKTTKNCYNSNRFIIVFDD